MPMTSWESSSDCASRDHSVSCLTKVARPWLGYSANAGHWGLDCFEAKETGGVVLVDLRAAYDTVWHRGLTLKLLRMLTDRHMVHFIVELMSNRSFVFFKDQRWTAKQATQTQERRPPGICLGSIAVQYLYPWPPWYHLQEVWLCRWLGHPNRPQGMEEDWKHPKPGHEHLGPIPEAVAAKAEWG